jgi:hypothetical protein
VLSVASAVCGIALGQVADPQPDGAAPQDEMIVFGRIGELRRQLIIAEEAVYLRFNDVNSDDRFDIHCRLEQKTDSLLKERTCLSNDWRKQDANVGQAALQALRGESGGPPSQFVGAQHAGQRDLSREIRRLAATDEQLAQAVLRFGEAQRALAATEETRANLTLSREVPAEERDFALGAQHVFEVRVGKQEWVHALAERTFTIASVTGDIRRMDLDCAENDQRLEYQEGVDWTVPEHWQGCVVVIDAKRNTTFMLFEFE